jgi:outer membrane protein assembly factor BamE (lipoprotein component of BamABCDE complex)
MRWKLAFYLGMMVVISAIIFWTVALSIMTREAKKITFSQDLADQISIGMTRSEVETILGVPPGDYTTGPCDEPLQCAPGAGPVG